MAPALGAWNWSYEGGSFEVWFASGGEFVCKEYPEHSSWESPGGDALTVAWGQFGNYTMKVSADGRSMTGSYTGHPDDWRKGVWVRENTAGELAEVAAGSHHGHSHSHSHSESCSHHH